MSAAPSRLTEVWRGIAIYFGPEGDLYDRTLREHAVSPEPDRQWRPAANSASHRASGVRSQFHHPHEISEDHVLAVERHVARLRDVH